MLEEMNDEDTGYEPRRTNGPWLDQMLYEWGYTTGPGLCGLGSSASASGRDGGLGISRPVSAYGPRAVEAGRYGRGGQPVHLQQAADGEGFYSSPIRAPRPQVEGHRTPPFARPGVKIAGKAALDAFFRDEGMVDKRMIQDEQDEGPQLLMEG